MKNTLKTNALKGVLLAVMVLAFAACNDKGTFTDPRDGQTYKTVKIGSQIWMAENLKYKFADSYSVDDDPDNDEEYGRLYTYKSAKVARPDGWHIPSKEEWNELEKFVADTLFRGDEDYVGYALKSKDGWKKGGNGTDAFGFGALPAGYRYGDGTFDGVLENAHFWCSTEDLMLYVNYYYRGLDYDGTGLRRYNGSRDEAMSVRCVKNF